MEYAFHLYNQYAENGVTATLQRLLEQKTTGAGFDLTENPPVIVCVGSDLVIGDSLGPMTGSMLSFKTQGIGAYIYGTLAAPITAKEVKYLSKFLKETHPNSPVVAIDAAVGEKDDIGLIKVNDEPLSPGAGANKQLGSFGDITVMGVVAEKSLGNYALFNSTRLRLVYKMSQQIASGIANVLYDIFNAKKTHFTA
ncbi:MAG: spore protease YyaC [Clostridia bacterium]|nr:spore protease YyaC [Clostridia bacterium]